jgi:hypothetical protein
MIDNNIKLQLWGMNLMVVSEYHKYLIIAVDYQLHVYNFDYQYI